MHTLISLALGGVIGLLIGRIVQIYYPIDLWWTALVVVFWLATMDLISAWRNEKASERGQLKPKNSIEGLPAIVQNEFLNIAGNYQGRVLLAGESWKARSEQALMKGNKVRVIGREGLILDVQRL